MPPPTQELGVERSPSPCPERARPRAVPPAEAAGERRFRSVWLARDEQNGLDVALKIVPSGGEGGIPCRARGRGGRPSAHPACQRAYGFGRDSQHVYIAYEYVPGRTSARRSGAASSTTTPRSRPAPRSSKGLRTRTAAGSSTATSNRRTCCSRREKTISVRVLDFGLAQIQQAETLTAQGDVPGTLAYISPERLAGKLTTEAADVWAVGLMLWEALAGRHPFWRSSIAGDSARDRRRRAAAGNGAARSAEASPRRRQPRSGSRSGPATECSSPRPDAAARGPQAACPQGRGSDPGRSGRVAAARPGRPRGNGGRVDVPGRSRSSRPAGPSASRLSPPAPRS